MVDDAPPPVTDLDWSPERASAFGTRVLELYTALLAELPEGPVSPPVTPSSVSAAVTVEVPDEPLDEGALIAHLQAILDHSLRPEPFQKPLGDLKEATELGDVLADYEHSVVAGHLLEEGLVQGVRHRDLALGSRFAHASLPSVFQVDGA